MDKMIAKKYDKENVLILIEANPNVDIFFNDWIDRGYKAKRLFKKTNIIFRGIRRVWTKFNLPGVSVFYGDWYKRIDDYDAVIIHMSRLTRYLPFNLSKKNKDLQIKCWYWNTIDENTIPIKTNNPNIEYWTFDSKDAKEYNIKKNVQYYCKPQSNKVDNEKKYDLFFVGRSKGRKKQIEDIQKECERNGLICNFTVIDDKDNNIIPYREVKKDLLNSKGILELLKKDQEGFTLRTMESLFYEIKLITNNKSIKESTIYNPNNIFILDEDKLDDLNSFMKLPYDHSVDKYKDYFELDTWFNNFFGNNL